MAVNAIAARRAYGLSTSVAPTSQVQPTPSQGSSTPTPGVQKDFFGGIGLSQAAKQIVKSAEAAVTSLSVQQSPQNAKPAPSILAPEKGEGSVPPTREEVEGIARRYLNVINGNAGKPVTNEEVGKVADFYGASAERAKRFAGFVAELEAGQNSSDGGKESVAVA